MSGVRLGSRLVLLHAGVQLVVQPLFLVGGLGTRVEHWPTVEAGALPGHST